MVSTYPLRLRPTGPLIDNLYATRPVPLTLSAGVINAAVLAAGLSGDPTAPVGSTWIGPAVTPLRSNNGFETNTTGWAGLASAVIARVAPITDTFTRADGAIGNAETGETWVQVAASGNTVLATIVGNKLVTSPSGGSGTAAYAGIDLGANRKPVRMSATISFGPGTDNGAAVLISNPNGLSAVTNITDGAVHIVFTNTKCDIAYFTVGNSYHIISTYNFAVPLAKDGVTEYRVGWSIAGTTVKVEMPDGTVQSYTNANFANALGRYCTFEHFYAAGQCAPTFSDVAIDSGVARFGTACLEVTTPGSGTGEGVEATGISVTASNPYSEGIWVRAPLAATLQMQLAERLIADLVDITTTNVNIVGTGDWQSVPVSATLGATSVVERVRVITMTSSQAITFEVDASQLETGLVRNPYAPSVRIAGRVRSPWDRGMFTETQGHVAFLSRYGYSSSAAPSADPTMFLLGDSTTKWIIVYHDSTLHKWVLQRANTTQTNVVSGVQTFAVGDWVLVVAYWTATTIGISVNGGAFVTTANTLIPSLAATTLDIGSGGSIFSGFASAMDTAWCEVGSGTPTGTDALRLYNAFGQSTSPKPTLRQLSQLIPGAHPSELWDGRTGTAQRRVVT